MHTASTLYKAPAEHKKHKAGLVIQTVASSTTRSIPQQSWCCFLKVWQEQDHWHGFLVYMLEAN